MKSMVRSTSFINSVLTLVFLALMNCAADNSVDTNNRVGLGFDSYMYLEDGGQLDAQRQTIEEKLQEAVTRVNAIMPTEGINFRVRASSKDVIPEIGVGGFNPAADEVILWIDPLFPQLNQSLDVELAPIIAHEMHHAKRRRSVGYGTTLLEALISEGLADSFSIELMGITPPLWSTALTGSELDNWTEIARNSWGEPSYNHPKWFFGTSDEIPRWAGYAIGYKLVQDYLDKNTTATPSNLHDEPAVSFIPE